MNLFKSTLKILCLLSLFLGFQSTASATPTIYYQENFKNYRDHIPDVWDDAGIGYYNEVVFAQLSAANVNLENSGYFFKSLQPTKTLPKDLTDYDVSFRFSLKRNDSHFALVLAQDSGKEFFVDVARDAVQIKDGEAKVLSKQKLAFDIDPSIWHRLVVKAEKGMLDVYIDNFGDMEKIVEAKIPNYSLDGINFYGYEKSPFGITDIKLSEPSPLPQNPIGYYLNKSQKTNDSSLEKSTFSVVANDIFGATLKTGGGDGEVKVVVSWENGKADITSFKSTSTIEFERTIKDSKKQYEEIHRADALIHIEGLGADKNGKSMDYYIRPNLYRYKSNLKNYRSYRAPAYVNAMYENIVHHWDKLSKASEHAMKVEFRKTRDGLDVYLDGKYADSLEGGNVKNVTFMPSGDASAGDSFSKKSTFDAHKYLPLDVSLQSMTKSFASAKVSLKDGMQTIENVPFIANSGSGSADVALVGYAQGNWLLEPDEFLARSPFDGYLSEIHFGVPGNAPYTKAWVLAAVDPDSTKDPILTTRITKYEGLGVGKNVIADTKTVFPQNGQKLPKNMQQVGTVMVNKNGKNVVVPLYLAEVHLHSGKIIDQFTDSRMDFEFLGKTWENFQQVDKSVQPDPNSTSAVQIFGVTLERSPITMTISESQPGSIFANDEKPETTVNLNSVSPSEGTLAWEIVDVDGKTVKRGSEKYSFKDANEKKKVLLPLEVEQNGWYKLLISAENESGKVLFTHAASFAILGKDIRSAKYDSPFGVAAWGSSYNFVGAEDVMFKAGIRNFSWGNRTEKELERWSITNPQISLRVSLSNVKDPDKLRKDMQASIESALSKYPHAKEVLLFHASGPGTQIAPELVGQKVNKTEEQDQYAKMLDIAGKLIKEKYPQLTLVIGDHGSRIADMLRGGGDVDYLTIANESAALAIIPEKLHEYSPQSMAITKDAAKVLSGKDIPVSGTLSFTNRATRDTGSEQQAQWYARDMLLGLVNNFKVISPSTFVDPAVAYFDTWPGNSGLIGRTPYYYPKKAYVAYATLTNQLDQVTFKRQIPTSSHTVYAAEFDRKDGKFSTALWAARGFVDFEITFPKSASVRIVDMYGREKTVETKNDKITVNSGQRPVYLTSNAEIKEIALKSRTFPEDAARAQNSKVVAALNNLENVIVEADKSLKSTFSDSPQFPLRQPGDFEIKQVNDDEKGESLELQLDTTKNVDMSKYVSEYATLRLKNSPIIEGDPAAIGLWIKGNSNWGRVIFEIEDANGEVWKSASTSGFGLDNLDWPGNVAVNFDGWNFVSLPLRKTDLFYNQSAGPISEQWVSEGGDKKIDFPIKLRAVSVEMNRQTLDLLQFKKNVPTIRLKDVSVIYE